MQEDDFNQDEQITQLQSYQELCAQNGYDNIDIDQVLRTLVDLSKTEAGSDIVGAYRYHVNGAAVTDDMRNHFAAHHLPLNPDPDAAGIIRRYTKSGFESVVDLKGAQIIERRLSSGPSLT